MRRLPCLAFLAATLATAALVLATTAGLPERVATHFGPGGVADGWMTRSGYRAFQLAFVLGFAPFIVAMVGVLPRLAPRAVNLPHRDHWLAPERRAATLAFLAGHACWLGVLMQALLAGVHWLLVEANGTAPPRLPAAPFVALLVAFVAALGVWLGVLRRRLRAPR